MISALRPEQIEQIDPQSLKWQRHFKELSMSVVMLLLASFHTAQMSMAAHMDTHTHGRTLEDSCHRE